MKNPANHAFVEKCEIKDLSQVELETEKFFFYQAEKSLQARIDASRSLSEKGLKLSTFTVSITTIFIGLFSYFYQLQNFPLRETCLLATGMSILFYATASIFFILAFSPKKIVPIGSSPRNTMLSDFLNYKNELQIKNLIHNECIKYQIYIDHNSKKNSHKTCLINIGLWFFFLAPVAGLIVYLLC